MIVRIDPDDLEPEKLRRLMVSRTSRSGECPGSAIMGKCHIRTDFKPADQLFFDQVTETAVANERLQVAAKVNRMEDFKYVFNRMLEGLFIECAGRATRRSSTAL